MGEEVTYSAGRRGGRGGGKKKNIIKILEFESDTLKHV